MFGMFLSLSPHHTRFWRLPVLVALLLMSVGLLTTLGGGQRAFANGAVSSYLFGSNLSLYDGNDAFLTNPSVAQTAQQLHVTMMRFPDRGNLAVTTAAAQKMKALGMVPLLILHYDQPAADQQLIAMMNQTFGNSTVYYEYGNERDITGVPDPATYTRSWNTIIPALKQLAPNAKFVGPVTAVYRQHYLSTFLQGANPHPDAVSWHEYPCGPGVPETAHYCTQHIDRWSVHIADARMTMQQTMGMTLPIMITEWGWSCCPSHGSALTHDAAFLSSWTTHALQVLADNQIFAANQYVLNNNADLQMIDGSGQANAQGQAFAQMFTQLLGTQPSPPPTATPPPVVSGPHDPGTCHTTTATPPPTDNDHDEQKDQRGSMQSQKKDNDKHPKPAPTTTGVTNTGCTPPPFCRTTVPAPHSPSGGQVQPGATIASCAPCAATPTAHPSTTSCIPCGTSQRGALHCDRQGTQQTEGDIDVTGN